MKQNLLIVDDDRVFCSMLTRHFDKDYAVTGLSDPAEAVRYIVEHPVDVVLTDLNMPVVDGLEILRTVKAASPDADVIIMTAYAQVDSAVEAMKRGAYDYMVKPFDAEELSLHLRNLFEKRRLSEENLNLRKFVDITYKPENIIGKSGAMQAVYRFIERVSRTDSTVLITGESGAGKELVARAIHFSGKRKDRRFVSVHCGALKEGFLEEQFSGHKADKRPYEEAKGGTLVLSEIGDLAPALQVELLAVIEEGPSQRDQNPLSDVTIIATTNKNLAMLQRKGRFRQDLFHRLNMFSLRVPPLRERKEDIPLLAEHFLNQYRNEFEKPGMRLSPEAVEVLRNYAWPGNVRELKSLFARICLLEDIEVIQPEHLLARLPKPSDELLPDAGGDTERELIFERLPKPSSEVLSILEAGQSLGDIERNLIVDTLRRAKGNVRTASKLLNITYETLRYRMKKIGVKHTQFRPKKS